MAGRVWQPGESKKFARQAKIGKPYYIVYNIATNLARYEDPQLYSEFVFTSRLPFTGNACTEYGSSAETICRQNGPIYEEPPAGIRNIGDLPPQVAGPLPKNYRGILDEAEIRGLEKRVADMPDPKKRWGR